MKIRKIKRIKESLLLKNNNIFQHEPLYYYLPNIKKYKNYGGFKNEKEN